MIIEIQDGDLPHAIEFARDAAGPVHVQLTQGVTYDTDAPIELPRNLASISAPGIPFQDLGAKVRYTGDPNEAGVFVWQGGRALSMSGFEIQGPLPKAIGTNYDILLEAQTFGDGNFAAVAIDPEAIGGFGSSYVSMRNMIFRDCDIGVAISLSGHPSMQNAENMAFRECHFLSCRDALKVGQAQSKNVTLDHCMFHGILSIFDCGHSGRAPIVRGGGGSAVYQIGDANTQFGPVWISDLYLEGLIKLGELGDHGSSGNMPVTFDRSQFHFHNSTLVEALDLHHLRTQASAVSFNGCSFSHLGAVGRPVNIWNGPPYGGTNKRIMFRDCFFGSHQAHWTPVVATNPDRVFFDQCMQQEVALGMQVLNGALA